ncbi:MAG: TolC family protein [Phycisphaerales bacterium]
MKIPPHRKVLMWPLGLGSLLAIGCVSLDPSADFDEAMSLVQQRSGWRPEWNAPWSGSIDAWKGEAPLSADQAVTIALRNNRPIRAALEGIASARADLVQSGLLPNPVLSATFGPAINGEGGATSISISLIQQLTDLWLRPARKDAAASALREQILSVSDEALRLVADVRQAHAGLIYAQRAIVLTQSHRELVHRSIEITDQRIAAGVASQLDVNRLHQLLLALETELTLQELDLDKQKREMLEVLGLADAAANWEAQDDNESIEAWSDELMESDLMKLAALQRLDVAAARKAYESKRHELRVVNLGSLPELEAGVAFERDEDRRDELGPEFDIEIPIFDNNKANVAKAMSELRQAEIEADLVLQRAVTQTRTAWLDARANLELVIFYRERVIALTQENLRLAEQAFNAGQVDMTVVLETQRELIQAESQLNELELIATSSMIDLEYAVGGTLTPTSESTDDQASEVPSRPTSNQTSDQGASS